MALIYNDLHNPKTFYVFDKKLFIYLSLTFIVMTAVGTLLHEFGHFVTAKILGFDSRINYQMTKLDYTKGVMSETQYFIFILGGTLQTILTGTVGFILLFVFGKLDLRSKKLSLLQWILIFTSLLWLRQIANFFTWILNYCLNGTFSEFGDEIKLAKFLDFPKWSVIAITALIGLFIALKVIFYFIPKNVRFTFLCSGFFGGIFGYIIWFYLIGGIILP